MGQRTITVIGGGASGMTAAIFAAREGARVTILEHQDRVGKKLLVTGNGRCNFSNRHMDASCYRSGDPDFPMEVIRRFPPEMTLPFFQDLGIVARERDGLYYPYSGQASAVLDVLRAELFRRGVRVVTGCKIRRIRAEKTGFFAETDGERYGSDRLILAAGSRAAPSTGSDGSGYELARSLGVKTSRVRFWGLLLSSLLTAVSVAFLGMIGFIGLIAPQIVKRVVGSDHRFLLPASALLGAAVLLLADTAARSVISPIVLPVGAVTSLLGAPLFFYLLLRGRKGR